MKFYPFTTVFFCFVLSFLLNSCTKNINDYSVNARGMEMQGNIKGAIDELSKSIAIRSDDTTPKEEDNMVKLERELIYRADLYIQLKNYQMAYQDAEDAQFFSQSSRVSKNMLLKCERLLEESQPDYFKTHKRKSEKS